MSAPVSSASRRSTIPGGWLKRFSPRHGTHPTASKLGSLANQLTSTDSVIETRRTSRLMPASAPKMNSVELSPQKIASYDCVLIATHHAAYDWQQIADNAQSLADGFLSRGANLVTGGTDNHLVLLDVTSFGLTGRQAESALLDAGVVTNRNSVPADPNGAWYTSGIRLGTPALTTRGFGKDEFDRVAELIVHVLQNTQPGTTKAGAPSQASYSLAEGVAEKVKCASAEMLDKHPLYPGLELS